MCQLNVPQISQEERYLLLVRIANLLSGCRFGNLKDSVYHTLSVDDAMLAP